MCLCNRRQKFAQIGALSIVQCIVQLPKERLSLLFVSNGFFGAVVRIRKIINATNSATENELRLSSLATKVRSEGISETGALQRIGRSH